MASCAGFTASRIPNAWVSLLSTRSWLWSLPVHWGKHVPGQRTAAARGVVDWDETYQKAEEYLGIVGLEENPRTLVKDISIAKQQLVEIAKALAKNVRLLILDEPCFCSLNEQDARKVPGPNTEITQ